MVAKRDVIIKGVVHCCKMRVVTVRASVVVAMATPEPKPARENIKSLENSGQL